MKQLSVRFYEDIEEEKRALEIITDHRMYGFPSARGMIIQAILSYEKAQGQDLCLIDSDTLAEAIVRKLSEMNICTNPHPITDNSLIEKALGFIESL